ncbi:MAG: (d)CMP kinase [Chloroflexi bacterium]|nr:(d)CMP kinase [Chloroflexota bacterium]
MAKKINLIAMDGPAASGKTTIGEKIAQALNFFFLDTGVMYRAVTFAALDQLKTVDNESDVTRLSQSIKIEINVPSVKDGRSMDVLVDGVDVTWGIRTPEVESKVSKVSAYGGVRTALTEQQRRIGLRGNMVMVGRDIGTIVFPDANKKFYLDASPEERARRRYNEVHKRGVKTSYDDILLSIKRRDEIDSSRSIAPLKPAEDAQIIDTNGKTIDQVVEETLQLITQKTKSVA